eukprot:gnl/TRDRNA2_/TRDRNA2_196865_c0_seq1.p1 gnl/TRDRNA2_/TRDRNA2_196865_c0~~gnl/TRDRNA2_/TRDRNA2_196865_c0_seq1.p1  ORF type:complete len:607 (-),score=55.19 gnl/TRDRNA2_/TRDRNA2_196865_c0_seq1:93-1793(-)
MMPDHNQWQNGASGCDAMPTSGGGGWLVIEEGEPIEVFRRMVPGFDNTEALPDDRWLAAPRRHCSRTTRPRHGWTERWLPGVCAQRFEAPKNSLQNPMVRIRFSWQVEAWVDWATGERYEPSIGRGSVEEVHPSHVRKRQGAQSQEPAVSFIVFRWGSAGHPLRYDAHSWGATEGSTISNRFIRHFFDVGVVPRLGFDYEVLSVFIQHSDEFKHVAPESLASSCTGRSIQALYFLWPMQGQMNFGECIPTTPGYISDGPFLNAVGRMELCGIPTMWPHHLVLWKMLASKDWVMHLCMCPRYHVPLTTRVPRSLIVRDARAAAVQAIATLRTLQEERRADNDTAICGAPMGSEWAPGGPARVVAKLGNSYEAMDVYLVEGEDRLAESLVSLVSQPGYKCDCVQVQQRVARVDLEARVFLLRGQIANVLFTRFARVDKEGKVREYQKAHSDDEAMREWFYNDAVAWQSAKEQIVTLSQRWALWLDSQAGEPCASTRIDYMLHRVAPGSADVWTGEVGEQGYSTSGIDPAMIYAAVLDTARIGTESSLHPHHNQQSLGYVADDSMNGAG